MTMYLGLTAFTSNPKQQNTDVLPSVTFPAYVYEHAKHYLSYVFLSDT